MKVNVITVDPLLPVPVILSGRMSRLTFFHALLPACDPCLRGTKLLLLLAWFLFKNWNFAEL